jgi:ribosome recycling factor
VTATVTTAQILKDSRAAMDRALESTKRELASIRSGKATPNLLDVVRVEAYGQHVPINTLGTVSVPEPRLITVTIWDKGQVHAVEKAIRESDLGLNPQTQGNLIRVPLPALNEERRRELVKVVHKFAEEGRIAVRHARTEGREKLKHLTHISEDDEKRAEKDLQRTHDEEIKRIDDLLKAKEAEIMEV